jgi:hypothetical protein
MLLARRPSLAAPEMKVFIRTIPGTIASVTPFCELREAGVARIWRRGAPEPKNVPGSGADAASHGDGVNDDVWDRLQEIVNAANRGEADAHYLPVSNWPGELPLASQQRAGVYLL